VVRLLYALLAVAALGVSVVTLGAATDVDRVLSDENADLVYGDVSAVRSRLQSLASSYRSQSLRTSLLEADGRLALVQGRFDTKQPAAPVATEPVPVTSTPSLGTVLEVSGTLSASDLSGRLAVAPAGPVTVRPAPGTTATVTGSFSPQRAGVVLSGLTFTDDVTFGPGDDGGQLLNSRARQFNIFGADDVTVAGNQFDGLGRTPNNQIWDQPAGAVPERFVIRGNTFTRFYGPTSDTHSEALYVGHAADGLIEGNTFVDNGTTGHVFFTWWGTTANPATSYPRRVCVRGNSFGARHGAYYDVDLRSEIPLSSGVAVDPGQGAFVARPEFVRPC
jgi:hypothetical protein